MAKLEFDNDAARLLEQFNSSSGAMSRRAKLLELLEIEAGDHLLDVGCGPGNQIFDIVAKTGSASAVVGLDAEESAIDLATQRCAGMSNVSFKVGDVYNLPFEDELFDTVMSSQVFEYLDNVNGALLEIHRVLKTGGRILVHDTDWGGLIWHSSDNERMDRILKIWDNHLADPYLPRTLGKKLSDSGFRNVQAEPIIQSEIEFEPGCLSDVLIKFMTGYLLSRGVSEDEVNAWANDLQNLGSSGEYFFSSTEYAFTALK